MTQEVTVRFEFNCIEMPGMTCGPYEEVHLGIQRGKELVDEIPADADEATFGFELRARQNPETGTPNFLGPYAQGTPNQRFVYLCWQGIALGVPSGNREMFRRAKIQLNHLTWAQVRAAVDRGVPLAATIMMTNKKGEPVAATVKDDLITWHVK